MLSAYSHHSRRHLWLAHVPALLSCASSPGKFGKSFNIGFGIIPKWLVSLSIASNKFLCVFRGELKSVICPHHLDAVMWTAVSMCFRTRAQAWSLSSTWTHLTWPPRALTQVTRHQHPQEVPTNHHTRPCQNPPVSAMPQMGRGVGSLRAEGPQAWARSGSSCL